MGIEEAQCADHLDEGGPRHFLLFDQEQLVLANVLGTEPVGRLAEVLGELGHGVQVNPDGSGRVVTDLEILQHPLSKWGHDETPFVVTSSQNLLALGIPPSQDQAKPPEA